MPTASTGQARVREVEDRIAEIARRQHGVATRAQLLDAGLTGEAIRGRLARGRLHALHRGVYGIGPILPERAPAMAAVLACGPGAVLSHRSAAELFGLIDLGRDDAPRDVTVPLPGNRSRPGIRTHRSTRLDPAERSLHHGIPVTAPARTLVDVATVLHPRDLERALARAERDRLVDARDLDTIATTCTGLRGVRRLREILGQAGGPRLTRSEAEDRFLDLIRRARLPLPHANVPVAGYEIDFLWPEQRVAVEVDGYRFHGSRARFEGDRRRNAQLAALGIQVIPLTWRQIVHEEVSTAVQIGRALQRIGID